MDIRRRPQICEYRFNPSTIGGSVLIVFLITVSLLNTQTYAQQIASQIDNFPGHLRVFVTSDIGNEPDDQMSFVRLLLYSNGLDLEGLVATTSTWQKAAIHPETMHSIIAAYKEVRPNLLKNAEDWPAYEYLDGLVNSGQPAYGLAEVGAGERSSGSQALIKAADRDDPRPLWVTVWGGANTLAQALLDVRSNRSAADLAKFVAKLRVSLISGHVAAG